MVKNFNFFEYFYLREENEAKQRKQGKTGEKSIDYFFWKTFNKICHFQSVKKTFSFFAEQMNRRTRKKLSLSAIFLSISPDDDILLLCSKHSILSIRFYFYPLPFRVRVTHTI